MSVLVCIAHPWICFCFTFHLKARRGLRSGSLRRGRLRAVLATLGFSEMSFIDSAQCYLILDFETFRHMDPRFPVDGDQKNLVDSAHFQPVLSHIFRKYLEYFRKNTTNYQELRWIQFIKKCQKSCESNTIIISLTLLSMFSQQFFAIFVQLVTAVTSLQSSQWDPP